MNAAGAGGAPPPPPGSASRLPVRGLRPKRPADDENAPPGQEPQKRARVAAGPARRAPLARAAPAAPRGPRTSAPAPTGGGEKKRAPWDLKGQVSDLRARVGSYKEKVQGLSGDNESLRQQLGGLQAELRQAVAQKDELSSRASKLAAELQLCQEEAHGRLQKVLALQEKERQLEETLCSQAHDIGELRGANRAMEESGRELAARLDVQERELHLAEESLARQGQENEALRARVELLEQKLHESEMERRLLHNTVQELKGNIRVFCRVRPLLADEQAAQKGMGHLSFPAEDNRSLVLSKEEDSHVGRERKDDITYEFHFDRVFPPSSSQGDVFEEISLLVQSALDGYHVCIFAYGQTGSGKTYTMEGPDDLSPDTMGMIPRAVQQIFKTSHEMAAKGWKYQFTANFLEIYNESLRDLLVSRPELSPELEIRRVSQHTEELHVPHLCYVPVASEQEVLKLLRTAKAQRSVAKTSLNERSSRSHSLFQLRIEGQNANRELHTSSVLSLVDLAGSERLDKSLSKGDRLRETQAINSSLSNLGLVITALSNKEAHIPYRNSKLTYLLQNSLGGNSKMLMFVNISPLEENFGESLNSLRFARKVNECVVGTASAHRK
ncbi:Carboxy-terminal kinesin 2 [Varanus komodoensis]|nr:Carboxy-terminal kinesin 2 [Varanus komodoensis]